jgi:nitrogen fixation NifU-like protein
LNRYNDTVLDHYQHPRNAGALEGANAVGRAENASCGDEMQLYLEIQGARVVRASFRTFGCAASIAAGSMLTELVAGTTLAEAGALSSEAVAQALGGLPPLKVHASVLAADALRAALEDHRIRRGNPDPITPTPH